MAFPQTARYKIRFRHSDTGLTPTFTRFQRLDNFASILPVPTILELGNGDYYFDFVWTAATDPDVDFEVDGGPSIPTEEVRYVSGVLSVRAFVVASTGSGGSGGGGAAWTVG
jgi:hypothetical protein